MRGALQQPLGGGVAVLHGVAAGLVLHVPGEGKAVARHGRLHRLEAAVGNLFLGEIAAQHADGPVAGLHQIVNGGLGRGGIVGGKAGEVGQGQGAGIVGQKDAGNGDGGKILPEEFQVAAQEQEALGPANAAQLQGVFDLVGVLVQVGHEYPLPLGVEQRLELFQDVGKEWVLGALHQDGNV